MNLYVLAILVFLERVGIIRFNRMIHTVFIQQRESIG